MYKKSLFASGGYAGYEYARGEPTTADETRFVEYHNNLRAAASATVGMLIAAEALFNRGAAYAIREQRQEVFYTLQREVNNYADNASKVATAFARMPFTFIRKEGKDIVLQGKPRSVKLTINHNDSDQERLLSKLIPGYKHPKEYMRKGGQGYGTPKPVFTFGVDGDTESTVDLETFLKLARGEFAMYLPEDIKQAEEVQSIKTLPKGMGVTLNIRTHGTGNSYIGGIPLSAANEGALPSNIAVTLPMTIHPELRVPMEYAYWALYAESKDEFVPFMFMTHINSLIRAASGATDDKASASFTEELKGRKATAWKRATMRKPTPMAMARRNLEKEKLLSYQPRINTNEDGYLITQSNRVIRLPSDGRMADYQAAANEWFEALSSVDVSKISEGSREAPKFRFPPAVLYVDHHNEVMVFTTQEGTVTSLSLRGARPLDPITIDKRYPAAVQSVLNNYAFDWTTDRKADLSNAGRVTWEFIKSISNNDLLSSDAPDLIRGAALPPGPTNPIRASVDISTLNFFGYANRLILTTDSPEAERAKRILATINDSNATNAEVDLAYDELISVLNEGLRSIATVARKAWASGEKRSEDGGVLNNMEADTDAYLVGVHTPNIATFNAKRRSNENDNIVDSLDRSKPIAIPNIDTSKMSFVFPHQAEYIQAVDRDEPPESAIIGAAPGGGKTNCIIADINLLLKKAKIKRPVVVVPNNLVRQFVSEINEFTNGKMNAFPLTYQHVRDVLMNPFGMNMTMAEVIVYLRELPRNTIIVTNYNTLRNEHTDSDLKQSYEQVASYDNFGSAKPLKAYPFVDILAAAGMDYVCGDESHKIKNKDSGLAQAFLCLCAKAKFVRLSSGTTINNVVTDLVGQTQKINPAMLGGSVEDFAEKFLGDKNAKQVTPEQSDQVRAAMREYSLLMQKDSRAWDYMLPKMQEIYHRVPLTTTQRRYYDILFNKAVNFIQEDSKIKADLEKAEKGDDDQKVSNKIERAVKKHFSVIDRFVNDPSQFSDFMDGTFVYEEYKMLHDGNEAEPGSLEPAKINEEDAVSVKAKYAYQLLYAHMNEKGMLEKVREAAPRFNADPGNKVIIMAPNRFVGNHVWNNMPADLKRRAVRYQAGAFDKVEQFKTDDSIKFMVADEISISEGHNLQVGSRIIRMQQVWTPGGETQSLARIRRPDPFGKYNRDALGYDIIVATKPNGNPTIDDLRIARLLAKKFNNAMVEFGYEGSFRNEFFKGGVQVLPPVRMSMDVIKSFPEALLNQYFDQQRRFNGWFLKSSIEQTRAIGREVESLTGKQLLDENGRPLNIKEFVAAVVVPTQETDDIQGTAQSYVPWLPGVQPINPLGFNMQPIRSLTAPVSGDDEEDDDLDDEVFEDDEDDEDDSGLSRDNVEIKPGDHVMTEFGPGIVEKALRNGHKLQIFIPSMPAPKGQKFKKVRLPKTCVYVPLDEEGAKILANAVKGKSGSPIKPPKPKGVTDKQRKDADDRRRGRKTPEPDIIDYENDDDFDEDDFDLDDLEVDDEDEPEDPIDTLILEEEEDDFEDEEDEDEDEGAEPTIFAQALAINGQLAITADDEEGGDALDALYTRYGFKYFPDMARVEFKNRKALDTFLAKLARAKYQIPRIQMAEIMLVADGLTERGKLRQVEPFNFSEVTNFMKGEQKKVPKRVSASDPQTFRLYPIVQRGIFYLCASISKHPFNVATILGKLVSGIPGAGKPQKFDNMAVKFYPNLSSAKKEAKKMISDGDLLSDPDALLESFDAIQGGHIEVPTAPTKKATDNKPARPAGAINKKPVKPAPKPQAKKPAGKGYSEQPYNPVVDDIDEFKQFVRLNTPTITLIKGSPLEGVELDTPMRVKKFGRDYFALSPYLNADPSEYIEFSYPDNAKFDGEAGTMTTGRRVWRLTYKG